MKEKYLTPGDLFLCYINQLPAFFGRVEDINPNPKKGWFDITFIHIGIPIQGTIWTLDDEQLKGDEFTINDVPHKLQRIPYQNELKKPDEIPVEKEKEIKEKPKQTIRKSESNVINMFDRKKVEKVQAEIEPSIA